MFLAANWRPARAGASGCRMFDCRAKYNPVFCRAKTGIHHQSENQFSAAFANKKLPLWRIHKSAQILFGLVDDANQLMRARIVTTLIIGDRRIFCRCVNDLAKRQGTARIFEENARPLNRTAINLGKLAANFFKKISRNFGHDRLLSKRKVNQI